jgi:hypothetical protein
MNEADLNDSLSAVQIDAVADLWRRERRRLTTSFSGTSMLPAIEPGQPVVIDCGADPRVGDVAVFRLDKLIGVHRTVARTQDWLLTWGDANALPDEPVPVAQVIGVIAQAPAARCSLARRLVVSLIARPRTTIQRLAGRVRLLHRLRNAWARGPLVFAQKAVGAVRRGI